MKAYITLLWLISCLSVSAQTADEISSTLSDLYNAGNYGEVISLSDKAIKTDSLNVGGYIL